jgi:hypothetical protein
MCRRGVTISDYDASLLPKAGKAGRSPAGGSMLSRLSPLDNYENLIAIQRGRVYVKVR